MPTILLFVQICLIYPFILTTNLIFKNPAVSLFTIYGKISSSKKLRKPLRKMHHRWTDRKTDGQMNRTDFIGPLPQSWRFDHVFPKFESKLFLNYLAWCEPYGMNQYTARKRNTINIVQGSRNSKTMILSKFT